MIKICPTCMITKSTNGKRCRVCKSPMLSKDIIHEMSERSKVYEPIDINNIIKRYTWHFQSKNIDCSKEELLEVWRVQNGHCAICTKTFMNTKDCHLDHDHKHKFFRGFLCSACNSSLGLMHDDVKRLYAAIIYLTQAEFYRAKRDASPIESGT